MHEANDQDNDLAKYIDIDNAKFEKMFASRSSVLDYVLEKSRPGDIKSVIDTMDEFAQTTQWLMNIGNKKGKILDNAIQSRQPKTILELGTFLGYSSLRMAAQLPDDVLIVSVELDSQSADIARRIHEHAGVANRIKIILGYTDKVIPCLSKQFNTDSFDFIFIDHNKHYYLHDFKLLEQEGLIKKGTMIVADNIFYPGVPDYLAYVRNNSQYTTTMHEATLEYRDEIYDGVEVSIRK